MARAELLPIEVELEQLHFWWITICQICQNFSYTYRPRLIGPLTSCFGLFWRVLLSLKCPVPYFDSNIKNLPFKDFVCKINWWIFYPFQFQAYNLWFSGVPDPAGEVKCQEDEQPINGTCRNINELCANAIKENTKMASLQYDARCNDLSEPCSFQIFRMRSGCFTHTMSPSARTLKFGRPAITAKMASGPAVSQISPGCAPRTNPSLSMVSLTDTNN